MSVELAPISPPWAGPINRDWLGAVRKKEGVRLFYLAKQIDLSPSFDSLNFITRWKLGVPFAQYWSSDPDALADDLAEFKVEDRTGYLKDHRVPEWKKELEIIFSDRRFFDFMYVSSTLLSKKERSLGFNFSEARAQVLGYGPEVLEDMQSRYQNIFEFSKDPVLKQAERRFKPKGMRKDEWDSIASDRLLVAIYNFYWDSFAIDSEWTLKRFLGSALHSIRDPDGQRYERMLEVSTGDVFFQLREPSNVEEDVVASEAEIGLRGFIGRLKRATDRKVVTVMLDEGLTKVSEIAERLNIPTSEVKVAMKRFKAVYEGKAQDMVPVFRSEKITRWSLVALEPEKYQQLYLQRKPLLHPQEQRVFEVILDLMSPNKNEVLDQAVIEYEAKYGSKLKRTTIKTVFYDAMKKIAEEILNEDLRAAREKRMSAAKKKVVEVTQNAWMRFQGDPKKYQQIFERAGKRLLPRTYFYDIAEIVIKEGITNREKAIEAVQKAKPHLKRSSIIRALRRAVGLLDRTIIEKVKDYSLTRAGKHQEALLVCQIRENNPTVWFMMPESVREVWNVCYKDPANLVTEKVAGDVLGFKNQSTISRRLKLGRYLLAKYKSEGYF